METQREIIAKKLKCYVIDAYPVAKASGMGGRINTIMQTCFFAISNVLPREEAIAQIKKTIRKTYSRKGQAVVLTKISPRWTKPWPPCTKSKFPQAVTGQATSTADRSGGSARFCPARHRADAGQQGRFAARQRLPGGRHLADRHDALGKARHRTGNSRNGTPRFAFNATSACWSARTPPSAPSFIPPTSWPALRRSSNPPPSARRNGRTPVYSLQVSPEDCTGCTLCVAVCPVKSKTDPKHKAINMVPMPALREQEKVNYEFFLSLPSPDRTRLAMDVKGSQFREPLFEYSGACSGCGETPYVKLLTQMSGDRLIITNATGCSSIYGGNLPTTPYTVNSAKRGPAWSNSLFEDNAEYGFGQRIALDKQTEFARELAKKLAPQLGGGPGGRLARRQTGRRSAN